MKTSYMILCSCLIGFLIILSNYAVQFPINSWVTWGALTYPFTFLISDIISENYSKKVTLKIVRIGVLIAIIPTFFLSDARIAIASILTFFITQQLDVHVFHSLKIRWEKLWWLRNNLSTITSQFFDKVLFFSIAFLGTMPLDVLVKLILGDYIITVFLALMDTPFFYLIAIKGQNLLKITYARND